MLGIMKKDFLTIVLTPNLIFAGLALLVVLTQSGDFDSGSVVMISGWIYLFVFGSGIVSTEQIETKFNGYRFLSTLPVTAKEIIGGKSVLGLVSVVIMGAGHMILSHLVAGPDIRVAFQKLAIVNCGVTLMMVGFLYLGAFRFGFSRFYALLWTVLVFVGISPIIALEFFKEDVFELLNLFARMGVLPVVPLSLAVFAGLIFAAIKAKEGQAAFD